MPEQINQNTLLGDTLHEWSIQEYEKYERDLRWYIVMTVLGLGFVLYAIISGNFLFALIIIIFGIILFLQSNQEPMQVPFSITELGVIVGNRFYKYSEFDNFYIIYNPPVVKTLFLETKSTVRPRLSIPLLDANPIDIRSTLREYIAEDLEKEEEPLSENFSRSWRIH